MWLSRPSCLTRGTLTGVINCLENISSCPELSERKEVSDACGQRKPGFTESLRLPPRWTLHVHSWLFSQSYWRTAGLKLSYSNVQLPGHSELPVQSESFKQSSGLWSLCPECRTLKLQDTKFKWLRVKGIENNSLLLWQERRLYDFVGGR